MQVVQNRRMIFKEGLHLIAGQRQRHAKSVTIVVVSNVMTPINQRRHGFARVRLAVVIRVNHAIAAIDLKRRSDQHDHVLANRLNERTLFDGQTISEFH